MEVECIECVPWSRGLKIPLRLKPCMFGRAAEMAISEEDLIGDNCDRILLYTLHPGLGTFS